MVDMKASPTPEHQPARRRLLPLQVSLRHQFGILFLFGIYLSILPMSKLVFVAKPYDLSTAPRQFAALLVVWLLMGLFHTGLWIKPAMALHFLTPLLMLVVVIPTVVSTPGWSVDGSVGMTALILGGWFSTMISFPVALLVLVTRSSDPDRQLRSLLNRNMVGYCVLVTGLANIFWTAEFSWSWPVTIVALAVGSLLGYLQTISRPLDSVRVLGLRVTHLYWGAVTGALLGFVINVAFYDLFNDTFRWYRFLWLSLPSALTSGLIGKLLARPRPHKLSD